jgi:hypothetical protein
MACDPDSIIRRLYCIYYILLGQQAPPFGLKLNADLRYRISFLIRDLVLESRGYKHHLRASSIPESLILNTMDGYDVIGFVIQINESYVRKVFRHTCRYSIKGAYLCSLGMVYIN